MIQLLRKFKMTMFLKYLLSYLVVFFVPFALILAIVDQNFMTTYKAEVIQNNNANLDKMKTALDLQITQLQRLAFHMENEPEFSPLNLKDDLNRLSAYKKLSTKNNSNDFISEIIFFDQYSQKYYSSTGIHDEQYVQNYLSKYTNWTTHDWVSNIHELTSPRYLPFEKVNVNGEELHVITYLYPFRFWTGSPVGTVMFQIDEKSFASVLAAPTDLEDTGLFVYDADGAMLYASNTDLSISASISNQVLQAENDSAVHTFEHDQYIVTSVRSLDTSWTYIQITSLHASLQKVNQLRERMFFLGLAVLVVGSILIYVSMMINYHPIRQFRTFIHNAIGPVSRSSNLLDSARSAIDNLKNANVMLKDQVSKTSDSVKKDLLLKLIKGDYEDPDQFKEQLKEYGLPIDRHWMCTVIIRLDELNPSISSNIHTLIHQLEQMGDNDIHSYGLDSIANDRLIFILLFDQNTQTHISNYLEQMKLQMKQLYGLNSMIGVGSISSRMGDLYRSFLEANVLVNYKSSSETISFYTDTNQSIQDYPKAEIEMMQTALRDYQLDRFDRALDYLLAFISNHNTSFFLSICLCYDIINSILKTMQDIHRPFLEQYPNHHFMEINDAYHTVNDLISSIQKLRNDVKNFMQSNGYHANKGLIDQMKRYMQTHYTSPMFSMQTMADHFDMSTSNISHYFKSHTGQTPSQYFHELRVQHAKRLLRTSDKSLEEISREIGYSNASSFIRMFKQHFDHTPGEYRKLHKQK